MAKAHLGVGSEPHSRDVRLASTDDVLIKKVYANLMTKLYLNAEKKSRQIPLQLFQC